MFTFCIMGSDVNFSKMNLSLVTEKRERLFLTFLIREQFSFTEIYSCSIFLANPVYIKKRFKLSSLIWTCNTKTNRNIAQIKILQVQLLPLQSLNASFVYNESTLTFLQGVAYRIQFSENNRMATALLAHVLLLPGLQQ